MHQPTTKEQRLSKKLNQLYAEHRDVVRATYPGMALDGAAVLRLAKTD